jgi:hypothetical protein
VDEAWIDAVALRSRVITFSRDEPTSEGISTKGRLLVLRRGVRGARRIRHQ